MYNVVSSACRTGGRLQVVHSVSQILKHFPKGIINDPANAVYPSQCEHYYC